MGNPDTPLTGVPAPLATMMLDAATLLATSFGPVGKKMFPDGRGSHVCIRTDGPQQQEQIRDALTQFARAVHTSQYGGGSVFWLQLDRPIGHGDTTFEWIEVTGAKINPVTGQNYPTGPQMLVYVDPAQQTPLVQPLLGSPTYMVRCQNVGPLQILGLA